MFPTISHLIEYLFGVYIPLPIQSFGFMMALGFLLAAYTLGLELRRKENLGRIKAQIVKVVVGKPAALSELASMAIFGFIIGYKLFYAVLHYSEFVDDPQEVLLSFNGNWLAGIAMAGLFTYLKYRERQKQRLDTPFEKEEVVHPHQLVGNITMIAAIAGLIGAKVFHNLENLDEFSTDPMGALLSFSGLTFYGGLIVGGLAVIYYGIKKGIKPLHLMDSAAPGLILAYAIGRVGCQLAGDGDWGIVNKAPKPEWLSFLPDWLWAFKYPHNVLDAGVPIAGCDGRYCHELAEAVFPTPVYETMMGLLIFSLLWYLRKRIHIAGMLFSIYLVLIGIERFLIEKIRVNEVFQLFGREITQAELISGFLILIGLLAFFYCRKNKEVLEKY